MYFPCSFHNFHPLNTRSRHVARGALRHWRTRRTAGGLVAFVWGAPAADVEMGGATSKCVTLYMAMRTIDGDVQFQKYCQRKFTIRKRKCNISTNVQQVCVQGAYATPGMRISPAWNLELAELAIKLTSTGQGAHMPNFNAQWAVLKSQWYVEQCIQRRQKSYREGRS